MVAGIQPIRILLIEDNEDDIAWFEEMIIASKILNKIDICRDGEEGLAFLRKQGPHQNADPPDLIFLDIKLPKKNGFEILNEMKVDPALSRIPVVILTGSDSMEDEYHSFMRGARWFMTKPIQFDRFFEIFPSLHFYWMLVNKSRPVERMLPA